MKFVLVLFCAFIAAGCLASSPRFREESPSSKKTEETRHRIGGVRFSSKHIEEEKKEDDRKVDVAAVVRRFSSKEHREIPPPSKNVAVPRAGKESTESSAAVPDNGASISAGRIDQQKMMDVILSYLGTPYKYGGETKDGIDCSAFTSQVYSQSVNVALPRSTDAQVAEGTPVLYENLKFGDLLFFNTTGRNPSHVGIYVGDGLFAHASEAFGVTISSLESLYYKKHYTEARRIVQ
ncbi:MAG: C40 family peptidase [Bacteroidota bacterium]|nr:C40 family peptidase [Bacteroidota bacterium]